ncbi:hypothetical protein PU088_000603 [Citrobacter farmeri]|uniref:Uncharacterized protein n=1 Tax=Citrobacter amalonaticus Y19 TaxID=1261127 RepID=A0A0F6TWJ9_CITAM|nr:hypothetical protein [Citrobacter amalonaticus]AKE60106.1 hypothetical protein F384_16880 [Citrobacter amalonaticus Y19]EKV5653175.1 hypothetical protein [Citrobacter farmeri]
MSGSHQSVPTQTLPEDRETLYDLVWREPAERIASLYGISSELLAKRCSALRIPRPLAGYWKALAKGTAPAIPALPALKQSKVGKTHNKNTLSMQSPTVPLSTSTSSKTRKRLPITGNGYGLINDLKTYLPASAVTRDGYYKPMKKKLLDLNVSDTGFDSAIDFLSRFFDALGKQGYHVTLDAPGESLYRADIELKEDPKGPGYRIDNPWRPYTPSIICVGDMYFAFNLAEMVEYTPAKEVKGRYVRDEKMARWTKGREPSSFRYVLKHSLPTGRFLLQLYSPYSSAEWLLQFRQTQQCGLISQIPKMIAAMHDAVPLIKKQREEARVKAEERHIQWELDKKRYQERERIRQEEEAYRASLTELKSIMAQWDVDKRQEQFFREAERDTADLDEKLKAQVIERLQLARQFLSGDSAVERLLKWKTPQDRLSKGLCC